MCALINAVNAAKDGLNREITENEQKIREYEDLYDSLILFKRSVESSENNIRNLHSGAKTRLNDLNGIKTNTPPAGTYQRGMTYSLSGIGVNLVEFAYDALEFMIEVKKSEYKLKIDLLEDENKLKIAERDAIEIVL